MVSTMATSQGLTTSRAFFVGHVNIFGMRLFIQIRYFFVNNRSVFVLGLQNGVTVIWVPLCFVYPYTHITSKVTNMSQWT